MKKSKPSPLEAALKEASRQNPLDPAPKQVYSDWLEEQGGRDKEARLQRVKAAQCQAYDPDFDYQARLTDLGLLEDGEVAVYPVGASGYVWVCGEEEQEAFCEAPELQAWLLDKIEEKGQEGDEELAFTWDDFWDQLPALSRTPKEALKALFQASEGRRDYYWVDGTEDWVGSWKGTVVREVGEGYYVQEGPGGGWGMLDERRFESLMGDGYLVAKEEWE
jgi:uncharacterized protein (TIGR02996 family)